MFAHNVETVRTTPARLSLRRLAAFPRAALPFASPCLRSDATPCSRSLLLPSCFPLHFLSAGPPPPIHSARPQGQLGSVHRSAAGGQGGRCATHIATRDRRHHTPFEVAGGLYRSVSASLGVPHSLRQKRACDLVALRPVCCTPLNAISSPVTSHSTPFPRRVRSVSAPPAAANGKRLVTKTSLMLGVGEQPAEIESALRELRSADVDVVTFGQYMRPTKKHMAVTDYVTPEAFAGWQKMAEGMGFKYAAGGPMVRSSYRAGEFFLKNMLQGESAAASGEAQQAAAAAGSATAPVASTA